MVMIYFKRKDKHEGENICAAKHKKTVLSWDSEMFEFIIYEINSHDAH